MKKILFLIITLCMSFVLYGSVFAIELEDMDISGFISQGFLYTDKNNYLADTERGSFEFNEVGITFQTFPADKMMVGLQIGARDLGDVGNDEVNIDWAYGQYSWREWLGVRAGIIKNPSGLYNETRNYDILRNPVLLPSSVYNEWLREANENMKGVQFFGNIGMGKAGLLKYQLQCGDVKVPEDGGTALYIKALGPTIDTVDTIDIDRMYNGNLIWTTPLSGLRLAYNLGYFSELITAYTLVPAAGGLNVITTVSDSYTHTFSLEYLYNNLSLAGEYQMVERDEEQAIPAMAMVTKSTFKSGPRYYVAAAYRINDWCQPGAYYSMFESDKDLDGPTNELEDICLTLRFDINESWIAKLEAHKMDGLFGVFPEEDGTIDEDWMLYAAKLSYNF